MISGLKTTSIQMETKVRCEGPSRQDVRDHYYYYKLCDISFGFFIKEICYNCTFKINTFFTSFNPHSSFHAFKLYNLFIKIKSKMHFYNLSHKTFKTFISIRKKCKLFLLVFFLHMKNALHFLARNQMMIPSLNSSSITMETKTRSE